MTNKEAIKKLKEILFMSGYEEAIDLAIKALEQSEEKPQGEVIQKIPKDFVYDTETAEFYCYRNKYTGEEIHIIKLPKPYILERPQGEWN